MVDPRKIKKIISERTNYPNTPAYVVEMIDSNNSKYEANIEKNEVDLALFLKNNIFSRISEVEQDKLLKLIEEYGCARYEDGDFDATYKG